MMPYIKWNEARTDYEIWYGPGIGSAAMAEKGYEKVNALPEIPVAEAPLADLVFSKYKIAQKLMALGLWDSVKSGLSEEQKDFLYLAQDFSLNDALFRSIYEQLKPHIAGIDGVLRECVLQ